MRHVCKNCEKEVEMKIKEPVKISSFLEEKIDINKCCFICIECGMELSDINFDSLKDEFRTNNSYLLN